MFNVSRIALYQKQIKEQKKILSPLVKVNRKKKYKVEKILNRSNMRREPKYLVKWKRYIVEKDPWERLENLENTMDLVEEFEKDIRKEKRSKLLRKYTVKILFR